MAVAKRPELLAESSPARLWRQRVFLLAQIDFWVVIAVSAVALVLLAPYTYTFADGWVLLTLMVQALGVWGAIITVRAMAKIEVETAIIHVVEARAAHRFRELKARPNSRIELQKLEEDTLPNNQSVPTPSMIRLFQQICKEAKDRKFDSSINLIQPYREEALDDIFRLQNIQKIALWLGILGTFIGLLRAIKLGDLSRVDVKNIGDFVSAMFGNLVISFSASLAGLEVAVIVGAFVLLLRKRHERYFQSMESAAITMLSLARNAINKDEFLAEFSQVHRSMDALRDELYGNTKQLSADIVGLHGEVERQTAQIQTGINNLAQANQQFDEFLKNVSARHQQLIDDVKTVYDAISLRHMGTTLQETITEAGKQISDTLNPNIARLATEITKFNESLDKLRGATERQSQQTAERFGKLDNRLQDNARTESIHAKTVEGGLRDITRKVESCINLAHDVKELSNRVAVLNGALDRNYRFAPARKTLLRTILDSLRGS